MGRLDDQTTELMPLIKNALRYSVSTWNPRFMDKLYAGTNPVGVVTEMLITLLNANAHVYHVSPVLTLMEYSVSERLAKMLGMGEVCECRNASSTFMFVSRIQVY
jgi:glutamate decarboxylase